MSTLKLKMGTKLTLGLAFVVLALDQLSKWFVVDHWGADQTVHRYSIIGGTLAIHYVENTGVAFGLLEGRTAFVAILALIVMATLVLTFRRTEVVSWSVTIASGLVLGGAVGNLVDRVRLGHVVDFVEVWEWPKFNVADSAITIGALMFALVYLRFPEAGQRASDSDHKPMLLLRRDGK